MSTINALPITETVAPADQEELIAAVASAYGSETALYPSGGGTSLDFGLPAREPGIGLSLAGLAKVIDYPARDMTITVEAGLSMQMLADSLAKENQFLPIDVPQPDKATIGGVIATAFSGPRRYAQGTIRDYVIGINAVDGRGKPFKGGGRVVKNVAGYDFCKLLTGSLGTLGVISQVTLRLKPRPERSAFLAAAVGSSEHAQQLLASLVTSETTPTAIELLAGPQWQDDLALGPLLVRSGEFIRSSSEQVRNYEQPLLLVVGLEGTQEEVGWMLDKLGEEWRAQRVEHYTAIDDDDAARLWNHLAEFPQAGQSPLVLKASMVPSAVVQFVDAVRAIDPQCSIQAHAGNGVVIVKFAEFPEDGLSRTLVQKLQPAASRGQGNVVVLSNPGGAEMTHQSVWGGIDAPFALMSDVKRRFDPRNILNPGRFVYV